jgi:hypothetical protein
VARDRQRAKQRKQRRLPQQSKRDDARLPDVEDLVPEPQPIHRENVPAPVEHTGEVDEFEAALVAGADGLDAIRDLVASAPVGTRLALEHAPAQGEAVRALLDPGRWTGVATSPDLTGRDRATTARRVAGGAAAPHDGAARLA